ncbi:MAG: class I SAM-dependent methyltransferase [Acidobacteriota bacterium]|nr:class I SAM-dependent methyltransferase [Acidobacteriota bacterium]
MNSQINLTQQFVQSPQTPCQDSGWKAQFGCPQGKLGRLVGHLMAIKNAPMIRFAVESLDVHPTDQVLEIGFGHGRGIQLISDRAANGFVAGIDISEVMVYQAAKRNQEKIKSGFVELSQASVADIPYEYARFNKVLAVNNYQFWPNAEHNLVEIQRVLTENGLLVLGLRMKNEQKAFQLAPGYSAEEIEEIAGLVRWVGFREVKLVRRRVGYDTTCVIARK